MRQLALLFLACSYLMTACGGNRPTDHRGSSATEPDMLALEVSSGFDFATTRSVEVHVEAIAPNGDPLPHVPVQIRGPEADGHPLMASRATDSSGEIVVSLNVPAHYDELQLFTPYVGLSSEVTVPIVGQLASHVFGASKEVPRPVGKGLGTQDLQQSDYATLGSWNWRGVPDYLTDSSGVVIDAELLAMVNASVPESRPVPDYNPEDIATGAATNIALGEDADVWVTFVHEGAGYRNALGFQTREIGDSVGGDSESDPTLIFPNVSYAGSGGGLQSGDTVHLGLLPAGTLISWFLVADGWSSGQVSERRHTIYSEPSLNPEADESLRQHAVLLRDDQRELVLLGLEDLLRDRGSDEDFNDAVFTVSVSPYTAIINNDMEEVKEAIDSDDDGVEDYYEDYPLDPERAFRTHFPAEGQFATLAYEDQWPNVGDFDFNDLVVDYTMTEITDAQGRIKEIDARFVVKAVGAAFDNGLGIGLPATPAQVEHVERSGPGQLAMGEAQSAGDQAVVMVFDAASTILPTGATGYVNTQLGGAVTQVDTISMNVVLQAPIQTTMSPPYDPFLTVDGDRSREVHLSGLAPTTVADLSLFDTGDDASSQAGYYRTDGHLPWAINVASAWRHPLERIPIISAYPAFADWVASGGQSDADWYLAGRAESSMTFDGR